MTKIKRGYENPRVFPPLSNREFAILVICVITGLLILLLPGIVRGKTAEISWDSQKTTVSVHKTYALTELFGESAPDMTFEVNEHGIRVLHSDCPGGDCVRMGYAHENNGVIVCVPNRVTVRLVNKEQRFDAVV